MDLNTVTEVARPCGASTLPSWRPGDAPLAGGTWLFSEPQPAVRRLIDLDGLGWDELAAGPAGLRIGAMCPLGRLAAFAAPAGWAAVPLFRQCCDALVAGPKVQRTATVGGNLCLALPAGSVAALCVALEAVLTVRAGDGTERTLPADGFVTGERATLLRPGELLRRIDLPLAALRRVAAFRRVALSPLGRSAALLIGSRTGCGGFALTVTAATRRPVRLAFAALPGRAGLRDRLREAIPADLVQDDVHGDPAWRRHVTVLLAEEIRAELADAHP